MVDGSEKSSLKGSFLSVLGIRVDTSTLASWLDYWAPEIRPFPLKALPTQNIKAYSSSVELAYPDEWRDTFYLYGLSPVAWLSKEQYEELPADVRRTLGAEGKRRCGRNPASGWKNEALVTASMIRWIEAGVKPSLHALASSELVEASTGVLPNAIELAGTFPQRSGPNCFGTVMAATGQDTANVWMQTEPFMNWLKTHTVPVEGTRNDAQAGTVLVWHEKGQLAHAAVTVGNGWVLHKASQSWSSPISVLPVEELIHSWTYPGTVLSRHRVLKEHVAK